MWMTIIIQLSKAMVHTRPRVNVNYRFGVIIRCQCRFVLGNHCTVLLSYIDRVGGNVCFGPEVYRKFLYLLLDFVVNTKVL